MKLMPMLRSMAMRKRPSNGNTRNRCPGASISTPISNLILKMVAEITSHHKKVLKFYTVLLTKPLSPLFYILSKLYFSLYALK